ncbi:hypothetical protein F7018_07830 [Tenacibaculum aiptasiae]|uniref:Uncharacterized protein n=1 Tax=Tenacibaculum aiptasiae TaxID=426481 RepID=A0A7J5AND1_9FLAO|nr:hypothetical protein [Tenacibaculum aiptasiae]KAB1159005.1 hypothetical protein F7018_07830 [Tenacibaculum aiptasiae]
MKSIENLKAFEISKEKRKNINGGSVPSNYELLTGDYSGGGFGDGGGRTLGPCRRFSRRHPVGSRCND